MHTEMPAGLVEVVRMAKRSITLEEKLGKSDVQVPQIQRGFRVASGAVLEDQGLSLRRLEESRSCRN